MKPSIYDTPESLALSLDNIIHIFKKVGVNQILFKRLAPNDNSKNQPYLASHISELSFLPTTNIVQESSTSGKTKDPKRQIRYKAALDFSWLSEDGQLYPAPGTQIIYYPQYPEVRLSGFLKRCKANLSEWMAPDKSGRACGRTLFLGIQPQGKVIAWLAPPHSQANSDLDSAPSVEINSIFYQLLEHEQKASSRTLLINELARIHRLGYIPGKRLDKHGNRKEYNAPNGGGYTLEAELGVIPNGIAEPDFLGWEIKQFAVPDFNKAFTSKPQTLLTPQPDGGFYADNGLIPFIQKYGYEDTKQADKYNFNGCHLFNEKSKKTQLTLILTGFDQSTGKITNAAGYLALIDCDGQVAASWSFAKLLNHWKKKHNKAAYIPSSKEKGKDGPTYQYGNNVTLFSGTTFERFLRAIAAHHVYFDPGSRVNNLSTNPEAKHRNQFRIKHKDLCKLYEVQEIVDVLNPSINQED